MHPAARRGTCGGFTSTLVMLSACTKLLKLSKARVFSWTHRNTEGQARWPSCASSTPFPNLLGLQPRTSVLGEKRQTFVRRCIHRAAIVEASWDQNDNADDCLPTVVSCSCGRHPAPLQWALVSQQPDHKSVTFLTGSQIRPSNQVKQKSVIWILS